MSESQPYGSRRREFREFVDREIVPSAARWDREGAISREIVTAVAERGYLGAGMGTWGGVQPLDLVAFGILHEEVGRGCSSVRSLLTVHAMVAHAVQRWGTAAQKERWMPKLATGEVIGSFALTEEHVGSDVKGIQTQAVAEGDGFRLDGTKKWITMGLIADLFLVFARTARGMTAFLVEAGSPGLGVRALEPLIGARGSLLSEVEMTGCRVPADAVIGPQGLGLATVASSCLDMGRYSVACGCVGIAQASLEAAAEYTQSRQASGSPLKDHQLIREMVSNMTTNVWAARLLCQQAGYLKERGDPGTVLETWMAKYFASTIASKAASDAVQIHGARGCSTQFPVERYFRDARIMEIIEGTTQIQQITIAELGYQSSFPIIDLQTEPLVAARTVTEPEPARTASTRA
jgi:glutaryl-CoA dehydrogenase (non-decarboxylating)